MSEAAVGLFGWPIKHSVSPAMHNAAFAALGLDWRYEALEVEPAMLGEAVAGLRAHGFVGANVTIPHKQAIIPHLAEVSDEARAVGAVNTLVWAGEGWHGYNTDVAGFLADLRAHSVDPAGQLCVVLGAGGAARAVVYALAGAGGRVVIANRTVARADALAIAARQQTGASVLAGGLVSIKDYLSLGVGLIVNATPVGMWPHAFASPWPAGLPIPAGAVVYDLVYRPRRTRLMVQAEQAGARAIDGLGMLVRQGAEAFTLWTGRPAPIDVMRAAAETALQKGDG